MPRELATGSAENVPDLMTPLYDRMARGNIFVTTRVVIIGGRNR
jgi:hypothetical protein